MYIYTYTLLLFNSSPWKDPPFLRTVNHLFLWAIEKTMAFPWDLRRTAATTIASLRCCVRWRSTRRSTAPAGSKTRLTTGTLGFRWFLMGFWRVGWDGYASYYSWKFLLEVAKIESDWLRYPDPDLPLSTRGATSIYPILSHLIPLISSECNSIELSIIRI